MAEILPAEKNKTGKPQSKKKTIKVDLTPMVDLGFLLISFFIFTTSLAHPTAMTLKLPDDSRKTDSSKAPANKTVSLILGANNNVFYYEGSNIDQLKNIDAGPAAFRRIISRKKELLRNTYGNDSDLIVLVKPTKNATYANVVNALDEMQINMIKTYVLMDASGEEILWVNKIN